MHTFQLSVFLSDLTRYLLFDLVCNIDNELVYKDGFDPNDSNYDYYGDDYDG